MSGLLHRYIYSIPAPVTKATNYIYVVYVLAMYIGNICSLCAWPTCLDYIWCLYLHRIQCQGHRHRTPQGYTFYSHDGSTYADIAIKWSAMLVLQRKYLDLQSYIHTQTYVTFESVRGRSVPFPFFLEMVQSWVLCIINST